MILRTQPALSPAAHLTRNRGSVTILVALLVGISMALMSMSQTMVAMMTGKAVSKSLAVKTGKRGSSSGLTLVEALLVDKVITYTTWADGHVDWAASPNSTAAWTFYSSGPSLTYPTCSPRFYNPTVFTQLFASSEIPNPTTCANDPSGPRDLTPRLVFGQPSNGGVYMPAGGNFIPITAVTQARTAGATFTPLLDKARVSSDQAPPLPGCVISVTPGIIAQGQPVNITVLTSLNVYTNDPPPGPVPPTSNPAPNPSLISQIHLNAVGEYPARSTPISVNGGNNYATANPLGNNPPMSQAQYATMTATVYGPGSSAGITCSTVITVYPQPKCRLVSIPPSLALGQTAAIVMYNSSNAFGTSPSPSTPLSPVYEADIDGTTSPNPPGATVYRTPSSTGYKVFWGHVTGVNSSSAACAVQVPVYQQPSCTLGADSSTIQQGSNIGLNMTTNWRPAWDTNGDPITAASIQSNTGASYGMPVQGGHYDAAGYGQGVYNFSGSVTGVNNTPGGCAGPTVTVLPPPCVYTNPLYYEVINTPVGNQPFGINLIAAGFPGVRTNDNGNGQFLIEGVGSVDVGQLRNENHSSQGFDAGGCPGGARCFAVQWGGAQDTGNWDYLGIDMNSWDDRVWHCGNCGVFAILQFGLQGCTIDYATAAFRQGGCFSPETKIRLWDGTSKRADQIHHGDLLLNPIRLRALKVYKVVKGPENIPMIELGFDGRLVHVTVKHPILTQEGLKQARFVTTKDRILGTDSQYHPLTVVRKLPLQKGQEVWNFEVDSDSTDPLDHMLLSDGVVTGDLNLQHQLEKQVALP